MRVEIRHNTRYDYDAEVLPEPHLVRLRPREDGTQRLVEYSLDVSPMPVGRAEWVDAHGNAVTQLWFDSVSRALSITSHLVVETLRDNPFDFLLPAAPLLVLPLEYPESDRTALSPYRGCERLDESVQRFAAEIAIESGSDAVRFAQILNSRLCERVRQVHRASGAPLAAAATLEAGQGSCRDAAVLYCEAARSRGFAARFVSGYELGAIHEERAEMHAWAELYMPGGGWRGYDPSRGVAVASAHIPLAAARDASAASPVTGSFRGAATSTLSYDIEITVSALPV